MLENLRKKLKDIFGGISIPAFFADFLQSVVIAIAICIAVYVFIATPNQIDGESMEPTFKNGEIILTNKLSEWLGPTDFGKNSGLDYQRGDVVVFQKPGLDDFIKRVIAIPGDKVAIKEGYVYINDKKVDESYLQPSTFTRGGNFIEEGAAAREVPAGKYFVLGDNRNNSHDSRFIDIGFINRDWLKGKVILRYWPVSKFGIVKQGEIKFN
ncbi:MAG: signal peptidase I [Candidatus Dojkabacteria bacterium]